MKALVLEAYNELTYRDVPDPQPAADEVLVRVRACGICGSDVHGLDGSTGRRQPPLIMGHEAAGEIAALGADVDEWRVGERVTFDSTVYRLDDWYTRRGHYNLSDGRRVLGVSPDDYRRDGAFAEYVAVPRHILYRIPDDVGFNQAALVEPAAVALHAVTLSPLAPGDTAVVVGTGMVGLFVVQALHAAGCAFILAVDPDPARRDLAQRLGAHAACAPDGAPDHAELRTRSAGRGADVAFEVVGMTASAQCAIACVRRGATVTLVGNLSPHVDLPLQAVVTQELRLQGSCGICGEYPIVLERIAAGTLDVDAVLSATAPLAEGAAWFARLAGGEAGLLKVILNP